MEQARPSLPERPCPVCGTPVEPLRARAVLLFEDGYRFLCGPACRARFLEGERHHEAARELRAPTPSRPAPIRTPPPRKRVASVPETSAAHRALSAPVQPLPWLGLAAAGAGLILGALAQNPIVAVLSAFAVGGASISALVAGWSSRSEVGLLGWAVGPAGAVLAAVAALSARSPGHGARLWLVGAAVAAGAVVLRTWLDGRGTQPVADVTRYLVAKMPLRARVPVRSGEWDLEMGSEEVDPARVRSGQEIVVAEGEVAAVDGIVQAGEAFVLLHPSARLPVRRIVGDLHPGRGAGGRGRGAGPGHARRRRARAGPPGAVRGPDLASVCAADRVGLATDPLGWALGAGRCGGGLLLAEPARGLPGSSPRRRRCCWRCRSCRIRRASEAPYVAAAATAAERGIDLRQRPDARPRRSHRGGGAVHARDHHGRGAGGGRRSTPSASRPERARGAGGRRRGGGGDASDRGGRRAALPRSQPDARGGAARPPSCRAAG